MKQTACIKAQVFYCKISEMPQAAKPGVSTCANQAISDFLFEG